MKKVLFAFLALATSMVAMAQWSENPKENNRITPHAKEFYDSEMHVGSNGKTYIMFNMPKGNDIATYFQILDVDGKMLFPETGQLLSDKPTRSFTLINEMFMVDRDNNMIIALSDCRNSNRSDEKLSYTLYKVSPTGEMLWGEDGIDLDKGNCYRYELGMRMIQLEDGSYMLAWQRRDASKGDYSIQLQRVAADGTFMWENNVEMADGDYDSPLLINAGNNQVNLVYMLGDNREIMVRKIDENGNPLWKQDTRVYRSGFPVLPSSVLMEAIQGPDGGTIISWYDDRYFENRYSPYMSYVKADGELGFGTGDAGVKVVYSELGTSRPYTYYDKTENCIYSVCREAAVDEDYYYWNRLLAQKIDMTGELLWGPEGIEINPLSQAPLAYASIQPAAPGECAIFYMEKSAENIDVAVCAVRLNKDGEKVWGDSPVVLANCIGEKSGLVSAAFDNEMGWVTMWNDERILRQEDQPVGTLYCQKINMDGSLGKTVSVKAVKDEPVSFYMPTLLDGNTDIVISNEQSGNIDLSVYALSGQKVAVIYNGYMDKGTNKLSWNAKDNHLDKGVYIATLKTITGIKSLRVVVK